MKRKIFLPETLPLKYRTSDDWSNIPLGNLRALLSDHAYLERKAASNALELLNRWPSPFQPKTWTATLSAVARDEASHLNAVVRHLRKRGWDLERLHRSLYAGELRMLVRMGKGINEILDRLLISAVIEARSCERFGILARTCLDKDLAEFYRSLYVSELGHYTVFTELAKEILPAAEVEIRWDEILTAESEIIAHQSVTPGIHSGLMIDNQLV